MSIKLNVEDDNQACDIYCYDENVVNEGKPKVKQVDGVEKIFKALADPTRLKIAYALTIEKELCVCDVAHIIGSTSATASHHLRFLKKMDLAKNQRKGKQVFYSLKDDHVRQLIYIAMIHAHEEEEDV
ncbi:MAG TPA: metalloregulator ArsR/SmtB family transcription factor [Cerasibacillus sp.]|uniref:ArsR/SmtB family transcription factor n=1 Tax=Cerasibacillus sp. TaxID=2498711 RepID=UPI002F42CEC6